VTVPQLHAPDSDPPKALFSRAKSKPSIAPSGRRSYWAIIADNLSKTGWSLGWVSALDREGRTIWTVDAHRDDGRRFIVRVDEKLSAFVELEHQVLTLTFYIESIRND
jgi:hypothetical protein